MKYVITILCCLASGGVVYFFSQETLAEKIENRNTQIIQDFSQGKIECIQSASESGSSEERLERILKCGKIETPKLLRIENGDSGEVNTGTASLTPVSGVPLGKVNAESVKKNLKSTKVGSLSEPEKKKNGITIVAGNNSFWKVYDIAIPLIQKYEGLHLKAYPDYKGCSIGWGTRARSCSERISQKEADKRLSNIVKQVIMTVQKDFPNGSIRQQAGLVSFAYNCHFGYLDVRDHGIIRHSLWCSTAGGKRLKGLVNRRSEESNLLFKL